MTLTLIVLLSVAGKLSVASPAPNGISQDDCNGDTATVCYEQVLDFLIQELPLFGRDEDEMRDTCSKLKSSYDCLEQYTSRCRDRKTDECDEGCRGLIVRADDFLRYGRHSTLFDELCDLESETIKGYLRNVDCYYSNAAGPYASCRHTLQTSASYLDTRPWSLLEQCCLNQWYRRCLIEATRKHCGMGASRYIWHSMELLKIAIRNCLEVRNCKGPPLPPEGENDKPDCSVPPISNGRALGKLFLWNHTHWKQASEGDSIRDGQDFKVECSDGFMVRDTGLETRSIKCSGGHFDVEPECAVECKVPFINNGIIRRQVRSRNSTRYLKELSEGEFIGDGEVLSLLCSDGYTFERSEHRQMDIFCSQGKLSPEPDCDPVPSCGDPDSISNGRSVVTRLTFPNSVRYECDEGFQLSGTSSRYCQLDGLWSGTPPSCERVKSCVLETDSQVVAEPARERYFLGDQVTFSCPVGRKLSSDVQRVMCMGESWTPQPPTHCEEDTPGDLDG